ANQILISWIGRLNRQKDPVTFIRAAQRLSDCLPDARFVVVGEDPLGASLEEEMKSTIRDLGLQDKVRLLGYRSDVERILSASDLVMHTSIYEGLGRSILETMLSGVPLVATAVDGVREAIVPYERGGLLAAPQDPNGL